MFGLLLCAQVLIEKLPLSCCGDPQGQAPMLGDFCTLPCPAAKLPRICLEVLVQPCDMPWSMFLHSIHNNGEKAGLHKENLLLRGCTIRNTEAVVGIVIYAGRHRLSLRLHTTTLCCMLVNISF